jgi:hypothetical protein
MFNGYARREAFPNDFPAPPECNKLFQAVVANAVREAFRLTLRP